MRFDCFNKKQEIKVTLGIVYQSIEYCNLLRIYNSLLQKRYTGRRNRASVWDGIFVAYNRCFRYSKVGLRRLCQHNFSIICVLKLQVKRYHNRQYLLHGAQSTCIVKTNLCHLYSLKTTYSPHSHSALHSSRNSQGIASTTPS